MTPHWLQNQAPRTAASLIGLLALTGLATLAHLKGSYGWQLLGSFAGILALALFVSLVAGHYPFFRGRWYVRDQKLELRPLAQRALPPLLVIAVAVFLMAPLLSGQMPLSHDHPVHLYKAWHFWEEMLLEGRLRGWSSYWFFGYPAEELYPIGPDLWVALFRLITLGLLSWEATYGLAFVGVFALAAYAVYSIGRRFFGPVAGVLAALLWTLDMGDYREGGWSYTVDWAVWVQIMAMAFALLALGRLEVLLERRRPLDYALCGLLIAAALLSHPMNVMLFGLALPLFLLCRSLAEGKPLGPEIAATGAATALGIALSGFWLFPMLARSAWTTNIGDLWRPLTPTVQGLLDGSVFANVWPLAVMLGVIGAALGVAMRRAAPIFLMTLAAVLLFLSSSTAFQDLDLIAISKSFAKIQYQRLTIPTKACLFLLAGFTLAQLARRVAAWRAEHPTAAQAGFWRRLALVVLLAAVLAPFARPAIKQLHKNYLRTLGTLVLQRSIPYWSHYQEFLSWSSQKRATSDHFYRISYELDRHNHLMMGAPVENRTPYYKVGYTPAKLFKHVTETTEDQLYRALSVQYIVSMHPLNRPNLEEEIRFGPIRVYEFKDFRPERYTLSGPGTVKVKRFDEERITLQLRETGPQSRLKLHVANYPRWRARQDGQELPITEAPVYGAVSPMLIEVPVRDGELTFEYVLTGVDWLGWLFSLGGLTAVFLLGFLARGNLLALRLTRPLRPAGRLAERYAGWAALALAVIALALIGYRLARGGSGLDERSLANLLPQAEVSQADHRCRDRRGDAWFCSRQSWNYVGPTANKFNGAYLPCIWAHPSEEGPLTIRFPEVTLGRAIVGHHGLADGAVESFPGGAPVTMEIQINGETVERLVRPNQKGWTGFRVDSSRYAGKRGALTFIVSTTRAGGRHYCFDASITP